jgi:hypothetical protein
LAKIAPDKWKHFYVGIFMGAILQIFSFHLLPAHFFTSTMISFIAVVGIAYGFELLSLITKRGHYDIFDAVAGIIGGVAGMAVIIVYEILW